MYGCQQITEANECKGYVRLISIHQSLGNPQCTSASHNLILSLQFKGFEYCIDLLLFKHDARLSDMLFRLYVVPDSWRSEGTWLIASQTNHDGAMQVYVDTNLRRLKTCHQQVKTKYMCFVITLNINNDLNIVSVKISQQSQILWSAVDLIGILLNLLFPCNVFVFQQQLPSQSVSGPDCSFGNILEEKCLHYVVRWMNEKF